jgi:uncharacterized Tic20 family protein
VSEQSVTTEMTQDDKIMAALGHATIIWPVVGIIAPVIVWATQREKSRFVAFQALQAGVYHMTLILAGLICGICYLFTYFGAIVGALGIPLSMLFTEPSGDPRAGELPPEAAIPFVLVFLAMFFFYLLMFGLAILGLVAWVAYIAYGLYGAVATLQGKDFRYTIIGPRLQRYLEQM